MNKKYDLYLTHSIFSPHFMTEYLIGSVQEFFIVDGSDNSNSSGKQAKIQKAILNNNLSITVTLNHDPISPKTFSNCNKDYYKERRGKEMETKRLGFRLKAKQKSPMMALI